MLLVSTQYMQYSVNTGQQVKKRKRTTKYLQWAEKTEVLGGYQTSGNAGVLGIKGQQKGEQSLYTYLSLRRKRWENWR